MSDLQIRISGEQAVLAAMAQAPQEVSWAVDRKLARAAQEVARDMRRKSPKAFSILANSIRTLRVRLLHWRVAPGVEYARYVEEGTRAGYFPPFRAIFDWVKVKRLQPRSPGWTREDLAWAITRSIRKRGTAAQPFVAPLLRSKALEARVNALVAEGLAQGLKNAGFE